MVQFEYHHHLPKTSFVFPFVGNVAHSKVIVVIPFVVIVVPFAGNVI
jgi:hypothetical protein